VSPKRSTPETDDKQEKAARRYALARHLHLERAPGGAFSPVDYVAKESAEMGAAAVEVVELKCRDNPWTVFPTVWAEVRKVEALRRWAGIYSCDGVFVVEWSDGAMRRIEVEQLVKVSGAPVVRARKDRDDERDEDEVYKVPTVEMEVV
jgi:hypothetical protein